MSEEPIEQQVDKDRLSTPPFGSLRGNADSDNLQSTRQPVDLSGIFRQVPVGRNSIGPASQIDRLPNAAADQAGFTQLFQSLTPKSQDLSQAPSSFEENKQPEWRASDLVTENPGGSDRPKNISNPLPGEFTRMYEALQPAQRVVERQPISLGRPAASPQPSSMIGGFTQLLRTLSSEEEVESRVEVRPLPAAQLLPQEQGEYTRIVSRSVMREASLRGHVQPPPEGATTPAPVENASKARSLSEATFSAVASSTAVAAPSIAPEANIAPQATPSRIQPSQPVEGDSLQRYLPLLLIANLFLTAVALIMLMVMLAHH